MKTLLITLTILSGAILAPLGSPLNEAVYSLTTDCNGYALWSGKFNSTDCE